MRTELPTGSAQSAGQMTECTLRTSQGSKHWRAQDELAWSGVWNKREGFRICFDEPTRKILFEIGPLHLVLVTYHNAYASLVKRQKLN